MKKLVVSVLLISIFVAISCDGNNSSGAGQSKMFSLTSISPPANTMVDSSGVLSCDFSWTLNALEFYPDEYFVRFVFQGQIPGDFNYPDSLIFTDMYDIKNIHGSDDLQFPLSKIWHDTEIKHPLTVRVELINKLSPSEIIVIGHSDSIHYLESSN